MTKETIDEQKVVSLMGMLEETRFSAISEMETYWNELRGNRTVPLRSEVDPRRIENSLEFAFIIERIAPGLARFRLAGTHLNALMGMEVRGMPLTSIFEPDARRVLSDSLEEVFSGPSAATLDIKAASTVGRPPLDGRLLLLPLKSDFGDVTRALGCLVTQGQIGNAPRRFAATNRSILPVQPGTPASATVAPKQPVVTAPQPQPEPVGGFNESAPVFSGKTVSREAEKRPAKGRPHLYLVSSNT